MLDVFCRGGGTYTPSLLSAATVEKRAFFFVYFSPLSHTHTHIPKRKKQPFFFVILEVRPFFQSSDLYHNIDIASNPEFDASRLFSCFVFTSYFFFLVKKVLLYFFHQRQWLEKGP